jgi:hypothetical protein
MDFTLMIVAVDGTMTGGYAMTSQLKSFPTRELAEAVAKNLKEQATNFCGRIQIIKLYL